MSGSALVFKVLRLRPPEIHIADGHSPFVFEEDVAPSLGQHPQDYDPTSLPFADRVDARAAAHQTGVTGNLILRSAFGTVYIGQRLRCAVILQNASKVTVNNVGINVELQSEHGKSLLYETMSSPGLPSLAPGQHLEVAVEHEIKELGPHTIVCSSSHTISPQGERTYQPQAFRFVAHNPLLVRTKHRAVGGAVFLEATLENKTHEGMLMESVDFIPTATYTARRIETPRTPPAEQASPLAAYIANVPLLPPEHGAASYVFELQRTPDQPKSPVRPGRRGAGREDPAAALGKLDIRWCGPLGGKARLQTQVITMPLAERKEASLAVAKLPEVLNVGQPFSMELRVENSAERPLEDLKLSYSPLAAAQAGQQQVHPEGIVLDGAQTIPVERIPPQQSVCVRLSLLPVASGRQFLQGLMLTEGDGSVHDVLRPLETFVYDKRSC